MLTPADFDEADFSVPESDAHPDEVILPASLVASRHLGTGGGIVSTTITPVSNQSRPNPVSRPQQPMRPSNTVQAGQNIAPPQPQTPNNGFNRTNGTVGNSMKPPPQDAPRILNQPSRLVLNQTSRNNGPHSAPSSPAHAGKLSSDEPMTDLPPPGQGFFSARAAANIPEGSNAEPLAPNAANLVAFNPHAESPSIPKTPGVDHSQTKPLTRAKKHVPGIKAVTIDANTVVPVSRPNVLNPQMDATRRIGVPGGGSPMANRGGGYKPPTVKRPLDGNLYPPSRVPLHDLPANGTVGPGDGSDQKRQRLNG